jgi:hypothetical protein
MLVIQFGVLGSRKSEGGGQREKEKERKRQENPTHMRISIRKNLPIQPRNASCCDLV